MKKNNHGVGYGENRRSKDIGWGLNQLFIIKEDKMMAEKELEAIKKEAIEYKMNGEINKIHFTPKVILKLLKLIESLFDILSINYKK